MQLNIETIKTRMLFSDDELSIKNKLYELFEDSISVYEEGYIFSPAYKHGHWDGKIHFIDRATDTFPTGLLELVQSCIGELQSQIPFTCTLTYDLADPFISVKDLPETITLKDNDLGSITLRDYQYDSVKAMIGQSIGIVNGATNSGKTEIASGLIQQLLPYLERGETIGFFTNSKQIFNQSASRISERLGIPVGKYGGGKKDIKQVNVIMIPTVNKALQADPETGLKLTEKERILKRIAKEIAPKFVNGFNQRLSLKNFLKNFKEKTKVDTKIKNEIEDVFYSNGTDKQVQLAMRNYVTQYDNLLRSKNKAVFDKKEEVTKFLNSITVMIVDEAHHTGSDTWYKSLLACENAQYRMALTGSIDKQNKVLWRRMQALFGDIVSKVSNKTLIDKGYSAKPTVTMVPIKAPGDIGHLDNYMEVYTKGIVHNDFRNFLIAKITEKQYEQNKGILLIVNWVEHGELLSEQLTRLNVPHEFIHGDMSDDERETHLKNMKNGQLKVLISTSIIDEGVDISGIDVLILCAGGKSLRQVLQRVGRVLRKKKTGENVATVFDFIDTTNKHLLNHANARQKIYEEQEFEVKQIE